MYIASLQSIDNIPSLSAMIGTTHSQDVLEHINSRWGNNAVAFGLSSNPFRDNYNNFMNLVNTQLANTDKIIMNSVQIVARPNQFRYINTELDLAMMPTCMQIPMLMMPQMYDLVMENKIWGWNWEPTSLPTEDAYGRILNNGKLEWDPRDPNTCSEYLTWEYKQDDPDLTDEEWDKIEKSRRWLADWIENELSDKGSRRDPTDLSNCISV